MQLIIILLLQLIVLEDYQHQRTKGSSLKPSTCSFFFHQPRVFYNDYFRLRVVPLSLSPSCETRKKNREKKMAARNPSLQDFARLFFSRGFLSRHARRTKRKRDYWGPVHTMPEEFETGALFLWLGLPSTLIRHENGAFWKRPSNRRNLKTPALRFSADRKHFEAKLFEDHNVRWSCYFPARGLHTNPKWPVINAFQITPA